MMRMIGEIVCPGILLLGEVVMEPGEGRSVFRHSREAGMPHALQCDDDGYDLAYRSDT